MCNLLKYYIVIIVYVFVSCAHVEEAKRHDLEEGFLIIDSEPTGATIKINENYMGNTPINISFPIGVYEVTAEKRGYVAQTEIVHVSQGEREINFILIKESLLTISSDPLNAIVKINETIAGVTPLSITLPPGVYDIYIEKEGYISKTKKITLLEGARDELKFSLQKIAKIIPKQKPTEPQISCYTIVKGCNNNCISYKPKVLYLAGGKTKDLFDKYLSTNNGVDKRIPLTFKVKFYEKTEKGMELQTVKLDPISLMGIESREQILDMFRRQLNERFAEMVDWLVDEAKRENADAFICLSKNQNLKKTKKVIGQISTSPRLNGIQQHQVYDIKHRHRKRVPA